LYGRDAEFALLLREDTGDEGGATHRVPDARDFHDVHAKPNNHEEKYASFREESRN
jgi:hypothetical protein